MATAVFVAISLVLRMTVSGYVPLFGANGVRVGVHGVFTIMPAILFGPWYGAIASGLGDVLGHFLRPAGPVWFWQITVIMVIGGFLRGWMWRLLRARSPVVTRGAVILMTVAFLGFGAFSMVQLRLDGITSQFYTDVAVPAEVETQGMNSMGRLVISRSQNAGNPADSLSQRIAEVAYAPLGAGVFGLILLGVDVFLSKSLRKAEGKFVVANSKFAPVTDDEPKVVITGNAIAYTAGSGKEREKNDCDKQKKSKRKRFAPWNGSIMPLALTIIIISLLINTANTVFLWAFAVPAWGAFPFVYLWLPRAIVALLTSVVNVFIAVLLLRICSRLPDLKKLVR